MTLQELKKDNIIKQKKGIHFIITSIIIWTIIMFVHLSNMNIINKNMFTFCATAVLVPVSFAVSKILKSDFQNKDNKISNLGLIMTLNQFLYILIAMWVYNAMPNSMLMVFAMIFGAHLLPFGWLYESKAYYIMSIVITITALIIGVIFEPYVLAIVMIGMEIIFTVWLVVENKQYKS